MIPNLILNLRWLSQFHERERLIGQLANHSWIKYLTPARRRSGLYYGAFIAGFAALLRRNAIWKEAGELQSWWAPGIAFPILLLLLYLVFKASRQLNRFPRVIRRNPQTVLHVFFWMALIALWATAPSRGMARAVLILLVLSAPHLLWRAGYMVMAAQRGKDAAARFRDHLFYLWPTWGGTATPFGKGRLYLDQCEAKTAEAYARSVLAGVKLLLLALLWEAVMLMISALVCGDAKNPSRRLFGDQSFCIPRMKTIVDGGTAVAPLVGWLSLYLELIWETLELAAQGHLYIGVLRLFGFNVFRNTYKPLLAHSIVDFWNRYHYYFKELLFEFFFLPAYLGYFRHSPKLRIFAAVFASAFVGNMYYHLIQLRTPLLMAQWERIWQILGARLVYCFCLALGIYFSMLRQQQQRGRLEPGQAAPGRWQTARMIAAVWTFFALVNFWNVRSQATIADRLGVYLSLFGL